MKLLPHTEAFLKSLELIPKKPLDQYTMEEWRVGFQMTAATFGALYTSCFSVENFAIERNDTQLPPVNIRFYKPQEKIDRIFLYVHGGGWCRGSIDAYDTFMRFMANTLKIGVLSVEYRLAPENLFPASSIDVYDAYCWVQNNFLKDQKVKKFYFGGDSAGGNLSSGVICRLIEEGKKLPDAYIGIYPPFDMSCAYKSYEEFSTGYLLTSEAVHYYIKQYLGDLEHQFNFLASPLRYNKLENFPKTIIISAECDPLIDEQNIFCKELKKKKVSVSQRIEKGVVHNYMLLSRVFPEAEASLRWLKEELANA